MRPIGTPINMARLTVKDTDPQRDPRAIHDPAEDISSQIVGAKEVLPARREKALAECHFIGIIRRQPLRKNGDKDKDGNDDSAQQRRTAVPEYVECTRKEATRFLTHWRFDGAFSWL